MLKLKRQLLFFNSVNFIGFKYLVWNKLTNKITQRLLNQFESSIFLKSRNMKFRVAHYNQLRKNISKHKKIFKYLKWYKINWVYNSLFLNHFNFYFSDTRKEQYFSSLFLNNDLSNLSYSVKHQNNKNFWLKRYRKKLFFKNYSYKTFSYFFNKRLKKFLRLRSLKYKKNIIKIFFSLEEKRKKVYMPRKNKLLLKQQSKFNLKQLQYFFNFSKFNNYKNFFNKLSSFNKFFLTSNLFLLESRLEFILTRINFFPTIYFARQFIKHGKVLINSNLLTKNMNKSVIIRNSSYNVSLSDFILLNSSIYFFQFFLIKKLLLNNLFFYNYPFYMEVDYQLLISSFVRKPTFNEYLFPYFVKLNSLDYL